MSEFFASSIMIVGGILGILAVALLILALVLGTWDTFIKQQNETPSNTDDPYFTKIEEYRNDFS